MTTEKRELTKKEWLAEGTAKFGDVMANWKFVCPVCATVTAAQEWNDTGNPNSVAFACIGRFNGQAKDAMTVKTGEGPCNYSGGGLFRLNPVIVKEPDGRLIEVFEFAESAEGGGDA